MPRIFRRLGLALLVLAAAPVSAQPILSEDEGADALSAGIVSMGTLLREGFQIMTSSPSGEGFVVFLQNGRQAYACEVESVSASRCGEIE